MRLEPIALHVIIEHGGLPLERPALKKQDQFEDKGPDQLDFPLHGQLSMYFLLVTFSGHELVYITTPRHIR